MQREQTYEVPLLLNLHIPEKMLYITNYVKQFNFVASIEILGALQLAQLVQYRIFTARPGFNS